MGALVVTVLYHIQWIPVTSIPLGTRKKLAYIRKVAYKKFNVGASNMAYSTGSTVWMAILEQQSKNKASGRICTDASIRNPLYSGGSAPTRLQYRMP